MLLLFFVKRILLISSFVAAQNDQPSMSYKIGYWIGKFIGIGWPYILIILTGYLIFLIIRKVRTRNSAH